eukprot:CAMPEP_0206213168 /NCGR_PEP_ID=MMETSP0047_2-20121206/979_1 /ASSEMBLY_ACC=CAM_ASM_000192 /TAXON_ID=195065 /ORGANISM="Chroomonas mesostigmatica_cf, Strain CCMP1168" /LENGTH=142 /DNA_ID=CAMNT_0053635301 /DNA_START=133 /DNA_END=558 /DNA_ORIENTATION=-
MPHASTEAHGAQNIAPARPGCEDAKEADTGADSAPGEERGLSDSGRQNAAGEGEAPPAPGSACLAVPEWACKALADPWGTEDVNLMRALASACQTLGLGTCGVSTTPLPPNVPSFQGRPVVPRLSSRALLPDSTDAPASPGR